MRSREEFGPYLLLKKLSEDPLGESFRAGRIGGRGVEQVVLLRVFNGRALDGTRLAAAIAEREAVQKALKSPHIGNGAGLGEERGVPYAAYDYISGKNLESLLIQASNTNSPIPTDHALLVAERLSLALSVAAETRVAEQRVMHGFALPHLVMVSNEGETRVLGFEVAPGLIEQAASFGPEITRYLAPELVESGVAQRSDDVFTLGATLFELLACQPLPESDMAGFGDLIANGRVAFDSTPFPPAIAALLGRSLAPREQRLPDAAAWHKALAQLMVDGGYAATTFNLAFFMHNLFRQEIEEESREIEEEKAIEVAPATAAAAAAAGAAAEPAAGAAPPPPAEPAPEAGSRKGLVGALAALLVLALVGAASWYFFFRGAAPEAATPVEPAAQVAETAPPEPQGPSPEEIQSQITNMIDERSQAMEDKLRGQYDERIKDLQKQLQQAEDEANRRAAAEREQQRLAAEQAAREAEEQRLAEEKRKADAAAAAKAAAEKKAAEEAAAAAAAGGDAGDAAGRGHRPRRDEDGGPAAAAEAGAAEGQGRRPGDHGPGRQSPRAAPRAAAALSADGQEARQRGGRGRPGAGGRERPGAHRGADRQPEGGLRLRRRRVGGRPRRPLHAGDQGRGAGEDVPRAAHQVPPLIAAPTGAWPSAVGRRWTVASRTPRPPRGRRRRRPRRLESPQEETP